MALEEDKLEMADAERSAAKAVLAVAQSFADKGDLRGFARALEEAAALAKAGIAERTQRRLHQC